MVNLTVLSFFLFASFNLNAAIAKKKVRGVLTPEQMVALGWRPTPTTAEKVKVGAFQGVGSIASLPSTLR